MHFTYNGKCYVYLAWCGLCQVRLQINHPTLTSIHCLQWCCWCWSFSPSYTVFNWRWSDLSYPGTVYVECWKQWNETTELNSSADEDCVIKLKAVKEAHKWSWRKNCFHVSRVKMKCWATMLYLLHANKAKIYNMWECQCTLQNVQNLRSEHEQISHTQ